SPLEYKRMLGWAFRTSFKLQPIAKWSAGAVGRILKNEIYTGTMIQGKESSPNYKVKKKFRKPQSDWIVVQDTHEPIILKEDFALVKRLMGADTRTAPDSDSLYLFSGMIQCGVCQKSMIRRPVKSNGKTYVYYLCRTQKTENDKCTNKCRVSEQQLMASTLKMIQEQIRILGIVDEVMRYIDTLPLKQVEVQKVDLRIQKKREEYDRLQKQIFELYNDYKKRIVSEENYFTWKKSYEENAEQVEEAIKTLETDLSDLLKSRTEQSKWVDEFKQFERIRELTRPILVTLVEKIVVIDKNTIEIHFSFGNEFESALRLIEATAKMNMLEKEPYKELPISIQEVV
ncbi:MAG: recombinase family protein, partial [Lachnospiraceae bacterium]